MLTEDKLIHYCAGLDSTQEISEILQPHLNWDYILKRVKNEGLMPLVYSRLSAINGAKSLIPEDSWEKLKSSYYTVAMRNIALSARLEKILDVFNQAGVEVILLKGMALVHTIYPNMALRPMYDIDILIHKNDFSQAKEKLEGLGYFNSAYYPEDFHHDGMMVDVHWEFLNTTRVRSRGKSYAIDLEQAWISALPVEINGCKAKVLSPEYALMELCLHLAFHHGLKGLLWFSDIARLIEHYKEEIDWQEFIEKCAEYKIARPVYYVLLCVQQVLGQQVPQFVLEALKPKRENFLERKFFNLIASGADIENARFLFTLLCIDNLLGRLAFLREIILLSPGVISGRYRVSSIGQIPGAYLTHFKAILLSALKLLRRISA